MRSTNSIRVLISSLLLLLACGGGARLHAQDAAAPLSADAQEALRKGNLAARQKQWSVALRYFEQARALAPAAPEPLIDLGLAETNMPGRSLRAIAWFKAYLVLAPNAANAAEGSANAILDLIKQAGAQLPPGSDGFVSAQSSVSRLQQSLVAAGEATKDRRAAEAGFTAAQRAQAWAGYLGSSLGAALFTDFQVALANAGAIQPGSAENSKAILDRLVGDADQYIARLKEVRTDFPEGKLVADKAAAEAKLVAEKAAAEAKAKAEAEAARFLAEHPVLDLQLSDTVSLKLVPIAAGTFTMGSENGGPDEKPVTQVTISKPFWLGRTEITQAQWQSVMGNNPSKFKGADLPMEQVSWDDAMDFCRRLTERERAVGRLPAGYTYTLPTEAQWEYACRAGTTGDYAGNLDDMAWYGQNSGSQTHIVAGKQANAWGLSDMHGNVWEWCRDWSDGKYPGGSVTDPTGPTSGSRRVRRGGGCRFDAGSCRSARRGGWDPGVRFYILGFRLALSSVP